MVSPKTCIEVILGSVIIKAMHSNRTSYAMVSINKQLTLLWGTGVRRPSVLQDFTTPYNWTLNKMKGSLLFDLEVFGPHLNGKHGEIPSQHWTGTVAYARSCERKASGQKRQVIIAQDLLPQRRIMSAGMQGHVGMPSYIIGHRLNKVTQVHLLLMYCTGNRP